MRRRCLYQLGSRDMPTVCVHAFGWWFCCRSTRSALCLRVVAVPVDVTIVVAVALPSGVLGSPSSRQRSCTLPQLSPSFISVPTLVSWKGCGRVRAAAADQAPDQHPQGGGHPMVRLLGAVRRAVRPNHFENREAPAGTLAAVPFLSRLLVYSRTTSSKNRNAEGWCPIESL